MAMYPLKLSAITLQGQRLVEMQDADGRSMLIMTEERAADLYEQLGKVLETCPTCGAASETFVDEDCPKCNPPVGRAIVG